VKTKKKILAADLACDYHVASNNSPWLLKLPVIRQINFSEHVQELMEEGPRQLDTNADTQNFQRITKAPEMSLFDALARRKSSREFSSKPLDLQKFGQLLGLSNGLRSNVGNANDASRNAPSAGSLCSCEMYVLALNVDDVEKGLYHYDVGAHGLKQIRLGDFKEWVKRMLLLQSELSEASALIFLASNQGRLRTKYGPRAYRLGLLDAGHVSENIYLVSAALNLAVTATGGFIDDELNHSLGLDGVDDCVVLVLAIGEPV
jgi:SagB-type dehydrogenase family enzyme